LEVSQLYAALAKEVNINQLYDIQQNFSLTEEYLTKKTVQTSTK